MDLPAGEHVVDVLCVLRTRLDREPFEGLLRLGKARQGESRRSASFSLLAPRLFE
jgi:hypothetical protein